MKKTANQNDNASLKTQNFKKNHKFTSIHDRLTLEMNRWTDHIDPKDPLEGTSPKQLQTHNLPTYDVENINSTNREEIFFLLTSRGLFPEEQKGCRKGSRGTVELLDLDQHILSESKTRRKILAMAWIDNKNVHDIVPQSLIINCLKMYKISDEVINFIEKNLESGIDSRRKKLSWSKDQKRYIWRSALSPLLFIITMKPLNPILRKCTAGYKLRSQKKIKHLMYIDDIKIFAKNKQELETRIHTVRIYSQNIGMEFGIEKCARLVLYTHIKNMPIYTYTRGIHTDAITDVV